MKFLTLLSLLITLSCCQAVKECGENEEFTHGGLCPPDCRNLSARMECPRVLKHGCFCKKGYVINDQTGKCVLSEECPSCETFNGEEYKECGNFQEPTCYNLNPRDFGGEHCQKGCFCKEGYVREDRDCIKIEDCPIRE
jgi:Trypsin Inhibitor like cysteine rich domain